jgi:hypothetical protein
VRHDVVLDVVVVVGVEHEPAELPVVLQRRRHLRLDRPVARGRRLEDEVLDEAVRGAVDVRRERRDLEGAVDHLEAAGPVMVQPVPAAPVQRGPVELVVEARIRAGRVVRRDAEVVERRVDVLGIRVTAGEQPERAARLERRGADRRPRRAVLRPGGAERRPVARERRWIVVGKPAGTSAFGAWPVRDPFVSDQNSTKRPPVGFSVNVSFE